MRTPITTMAALVAVLAWGACATAHAEVELREVPADAEPVYSLDNGLVRTTVDPVDGAALRVGWAGPEGAPERSAASPIGPCPTRWPYCSFTGPTAPGSKWPKR